MNNLRRASIFFILSCCCPLVVTAQSVNTNQHGSNNERVYKATEVTQRAKILSRPQPIGNSAVENNVDGSVVLRAVLSSTGEVRDITVVEGLPFGLTEESIEAAKMIRFKPAVKDGRLVSQSVILEYNFNIYSEDEVDKKVVIIDKPEPVCTEEARANKFTGRVTVRALLMRNGEVRRIGFPAGEPPYRLAGSLKRAAQLIKFRPAEKHGRMVSQYGAVEYDLSSACK